jgi:hypothetical protein
MARAFQSFGLLNHSFWADDYIVAGQGLPRNCTLRAGGPMRSRCKSNVGARGKPRRADRRLSENASKTEPARDDSRYPKLNIRIRNQNLQLGIFFQRFQKILRVVTFSPFFRDGAAEKKLL